MNEEVVFAVDGMRCGGCAWGLEQALLRASGVEAAEVNLARRVARICFSPDEITTAELRGRIEAAGYQAYWYRPSAEEDALSVEYRSRLRHLGIAALLGMQLMMVAGALYAGEWLGMSAEFERLFRWLGLGLAVVLLVIPAQSFFASARNAVAHGFVNMDVPIALGLGIAFLASARATVFETGAVYYDSMGMFVVLLLGARFLEFVARRRSMEQVWALGRAAPALAHRLREGGGVEVIAAEELNPGDRVVVRAGDCVPADGVVRRGSSTVEESLLTGESAPARRDIGDRMLAGTNNIESSLEIEVEHVGEATVRAALAARAAQAGRNKPRMAQVADRVASWFVGIILALALLVAVTWFIYEPSRWLEVTIAVLIVTCPCALSLATPCAIAAGIQAMAKKGIYITRADVIERFGSLSRFVFDKTGTLTEDRLAVDAVDLAPGYSARDCLAVAGALETFVNHPIARALVDEANTMASGKTAVCEGEKVVVGQGVHGWVEGEEYWLGAPGFCGATNVIADGPTAVLANRGGVMATFRLSEVIRQGTGELVRSLERQGLGCAIYSGDAKGAVAGVADRLGIVHWGAAMSPEEKLTKIRRHQALGERVAMVGDGLNDTPALAAADISVAMGSAAACAEQPADAVLVRPDLTLLQWAVAKSRQVNRIVVQNMAWAVMYNLLAVPAAALGLLAPWAAAIGMSLSSLIVVANALRAAQTS